MGFYLYCAKVSSLKSASAQLDEEAHRVSAAGAGTSMGGMSVLH